MSYVSLCLGPIPKNNIFCLSQFSDWRENHPFGVVGAARVRPRKWVLGRNFNRHFYDKNSRANARFKEGLINFTSSINDFHDQHCSSLLGNISK